MWSHSRMRGWRRRGLARRGAAAATAARSAGTTCTIRKRFLACKVQYHEDVTHACALCVYLRVPDKHNWSNSRYGIKRAASDSAALGALLGKLEHRHIWRRGELSELLDALRVAPAGGVELVAACAPHTECMAAVRAVSGGNGASALVASRVVDHAGRDAALAALAQALSIDAELAAIVYDQACSESGVVDAGKGDSPCAARWQVRCARCSRVASPQGLNPQPNVISSFWQQARCTPRHDRTW